MKKYIVLLLLLITPMLVNAKEVDKVKYEITNAYINSNIDFIGSMHVQEVFITKGSLNKYTREIVIKDSSLEKYTKGKINFEKSSFYNARNVSIKSVSAFKVKEKDIGFNLLSGLKDSYKKSKTAKKGDEKVYTEKNTDDGKIISIYSPNEEGYMAYYIEYFVDQAVVLHNDVAELYYNFIPSGGDNIKHLELQVITPGSSSKDKFKVWAHGSLSGEIVPVGSNEEESSDKVYSGALVRLDNIKNTTNVSIRMLFDKDLMSIAKPILNKSGMDAYKEINKLESKKVDKTNSTKNIKKALNLSLNISSGIFLAGVIVSSILYIIKKLGFKNKLEKILYIVISLFGLFMGIINIALNKSVNIVAMATIIIAIIYVIMMSILKNKSDGLLTPKKKR